MFPRRLGAAENPEQRRTITIGNGSTELIQIFGKMINYPEHGIPIGEKNVVPHHRIARGNPGKITEPTCGIAEDIHILIFARQSVYQRKSDQMG